MNTIWNAVIELWPELNGNCKMLMIQVQRFPVTDITMKTNIIHSKCLFFLNLIWCLEFLFMNWTMLLTFVLHARVSLTQKHGLLSCLSWSALLGLVSTWLLSLKVTTDHSQTAETFFILIDSINIQLLFFLITTLVSLGEKQLNKIVAWENLNFMKTFGNYWNNQDIKPFYKYLLVHYPNNISDPTYGPKWAKIQESS